MRRRTYVNPMRIPMSRTRDDSLPVCPDCGGLECLCRPRFFAGQLLTEHELNALDTYIVEKNKLHNRYVHGWGVVCGLEVRCGECGEELIVSPGYALSPCGEDIVVCREAPVDICKLIDQCREPEEVNCEPPEVREKQCAERPRTWVLAIRYNEYSTRSIKPLRGSDPACGPGTRYAATSGGPRASGGCCGQQAPSPASQPAPEADSECSPSLACEPTMVCESYDFEVYEEPKRSRTGKLPWLLRGGEIRRRFLECVLCYVEAVPDPPGADEKSGAILYEWMCNYREALLEYLREHPFYYCELVSRLERMVIPLHDPEKYDQGQYLKEYHKVKAKFEGIDTLIVTACLCRALMPHCPEPVEHNRVPLATVTVRGSGDNCKILAVCNWTTLRKYVWTFPTVTEWLAELPLVDLLREFLEKICCVPRQVRVLEIPFDERADTIGSLIDNETGDAATEETTGESIEENQILAGITGKQSTMSQMQRLIRLAQTVLTGIGKTPDINRMVQGLMARTGPEGEEILSEDERAAPIALLMNEMMAKPTLRAMLSDAAISKGGFMSVLRLAGLAATAGDETAGEVNELRKKVTRLEKKVTELGRKAKGK